jgi:hypothetical protein
MWTKGFVSSAALALALFAATASNAYAQSGLAAQDDAHTGYIFAISGYNSTNDDNAYNGMFAALNGNFDCIVGNAGYPNYFLQAYSNLSNAGDLLYAAYNDTGDMDCYIASMYCYQAAQEAYDACFESYSPVRASYDLSRNRGA